MCPNSWLATWFSLTCTTVIHQNSRTMGPQHWSSTALSYTNLSTLWSSLLQVFHCTQEKLILQLPSCCMAGEQSWRGADWGSSTSEQQSKRQLYPLVTPTRTHHSQPEAGLGERRERCWVKKSTPSASTTSFSNEVSNLNCVAFRVSHERSGEVGLGDHSNSGISSERAFHVILLDELCVIHIHLLH